ncbi:F390 synthetase-related protein [Paenibacillus campi]|uniref:F390 synthetase-related protein n=1 Tax=Paenibacillus campi TaxID=3106031 RepID=UPI002AFE4D55|nr:F390 synthetase-related protein [Paenibacillus sp. SGZ-1014]
MSNILRIMYHYWRTRRLARRWQDRAGLERWQERQIVRHLKWVRRHSTFYRQWWAGVPDADWRRFPLIDKSIMMEHFDELNTVRLTRTQAQAIALEAERTRDFEPQLHGVTIGLSSGTSGNRGLFVISPQEQAAWTGTVLAKLLSGGLRQRHRIAFFLRANSNLYESVRKGNLQFRYFDLTVPMEQHIAVLEQEQPDIWVAPASLLRLLADAAHAGRLTVKPWRIISVAEVLDPLDRERIEQAFRQRVHQVYQCTEGFLGATCEHGTLHLNEDVVHIEREYIDGQKQRFVPIITDFSRRAQPIVRYRLNDILTLAEQPCACGSPFAAVERIEGRCDDILYIRRLAEQESHEDEQQEQETALVPLFPDLVTRAIIAASPHIEHYQVIQHDKDRLEILYRLSGEDTDATVEAQIRERLKQLCAGLDGALPALRFGAYHFQPGTVKLRRVERRWQPDGASGMV